MKTFNVKRILINIGIMVVLIYIGTIMLLEIMTVNRITPIKDMVELQRRTFILEATGHKISKKEIASMIEQNFSQHVRAAYTITLSGDDQNWAVTCFQPQGAFPFWLPSKDKEITILTSTSKDVLVIHADGTVVNFSPSNEAPSAK